MPARWQPRTRNDADGDSQGGAGVHDGGDIYRGDVLIISRQFGYDWRDLETIQAMVEAYNKEAKS